MSMFFRHFVLAAPLFATVLVGYLIARVPGWRPAWSQCLSRLVFAVIVPAMLFGMLSNLSGLPAVDPRLLLAFFGGCFIVFVLGRLLAATVFKLDGVAQSIFGLGGVFSNNVMLG